MRNLRAALTASIDTIRMGIRLWRTAKKRDREAPQAQHHPYYDKTPA